MNALLSWLLYNFWTSSWSEQTVSISLLIWSSARSTRYRSRYSPTSFRKVLLWAVSLSVYSYRCIHMKGQDIVSADFLTHWAAPSIRHQVSFLVGLLSSYPSFERPSTPNFAALQQAAKGLSETIQSVNNLWCKASSGIWIPENAGDLQLQLCIIKHTGLSGHRGADFTTGFQQNYFFWYDFLEDIHGFVRAYSVNLLPLDSWKWAMGNGK